MRTVTIAELDLPDEPPTPGRGDPPSAHVRAKLDTGLRAVLAHEAGARAGTDPEELHQMRVAVRRMRSVLKQSRALLGPDADAVRAELSWLADALGEVRDFDVLIGHLEATVADFDDRDQAAARRLLAGLASERKQARRRLSRKLGTAKYARLLREVGKLTRCPDGAAGEVAASEYQDEGSLVASLRRPRKNLSKAVVAMQPVPADDDLHALRIRGKRLRYAAELAAPAAGKKTAKRIKSLIKATKQLQDTLGAHQDAIVAAERMRELADGTTDSELGFVAGRIVEHESRRRAKARADWPKEAARVDSAAKALLD